MKALTLFAALATLTLLMPLALATDPVNVAARASCGAVPARTPTSFDFLRDSPANLVLDDADARALEWDLEEPKHWCQDNAQDIHGPVHV